MVDVVRIAYFQQASQIGIRWGNFKDTPQTNDMEDPNFFCNVPFLGVVSMSIW